MSDANKAMGLEWIADGPEINTPTLSLRMFGKIMAPQHHIRIVTVRCSPGGRHCPMYHRLRVWWCGLVSSGLGMERMMDAIHGTGRCDLWSSLQSIVVFRRGLNTSGTSMRMCMAKENLTWLLIDSSSPFDLWLVRIMNRWKKESYNFDCPETKLLIWEIIANTFIRWPAQDIVILGMDWTSPVLPESCDHIFAFINHICKFWIRLQVIFQAWKGCCQRLLWIVQCQRTKTDVSNVPCSCHFN